MKIRQGTIDALQMDWRIHDDPQASPEVRLYAAVLERAIHDWSDNRWRDFNALPPYRLHNSGANVNVIRQSGVERLRDWFFCDEETSPDGGISFMSACGAISETPRVLAAAVRAWVLAVDRGEAKRRRSIYGCKTRRI
jgi:hypothetical protein